MNNQAIINTATKQDEYIEILKKHFPSVINQLDDGSYIIDKEQLQMMVEPKNCKIIEDGYGLKWVGKKEAYHNAYIHNKKILKPLVEDSKNFDTTDNILIKGDNLEALKLLKNNYFEKIKMIYIDPPYNTQSDGFIYNDNFSKSQEDVLEELGYSEEQKEYIKNIAGAKTHSGWLNFMYPRLLLARDLLKDDGVIFISIDDNEQANLKLLCDEVFGQENFITDFTWQTKNAARGVPTTTMLMSNHEHIVCYAKNQLIFKFLGLTRDDSDFSNPDNDERGLWRSEGMSATGGSTNIFKITNPNTNIIYENNWAFSKSTVEKMIKDNLILFPKTEQGVPRQKKFKNSYRNDKKAFVSSLGWHSTENSTKYLMNMFNGSKTFDFPKPISLIKFIISQTLHNNNTVLDFFAGSGTTGDAVMQLNAEDGGNRKYILVQLPEQIDQNKKDHVYNFITKELKKDPTIFEITAERLRRSGDKIIKDNLESKEPKDLNTLDIGFKVYEIANDEYNSIYDKKISDVTQQELELLSNDELHRADNLTILTNLLLGSGITLDTKIKTIIEDSLYQVDNKLFILKEFDLKNELFIDIEYAIVYARYFTNDSFIANLTSFIDKDKIIIKN